MLNVGSQAADSASLATADVLRRPGASGDDPVARLRASFGDDNDAAADTAAAGVGPVKPKRAKKPKQQSGKVKKSK